MMDGIRRKVQTVSLIDHPNLLVAHCSFTCRHNVWVVIFKLCWGILPSYNEIWLSWGIWRPVIVTLLREVIKACLSPFGHAHIHRYVKVVLYILLRIFPFPFLPPLLFKDIWLLNMLNGVSLRTKCLNPSIFISFVF